MKIKSFTTAIAALLVASFGVTAYAQGAQQTPPPQTPPQTSAMSNQSMSNNNMSGDRVTKKVKQELKSHGMSSNDISVTFQNGTAMLGGTVASQRDVTKAKSAAMRVKGVKHVDTSGLQVQAQRGQGQGAG